MALQACYLLSIVLVFLSAGTNGLNLRQWGARAMTTNSSQDDLQKCDADFDNPLGYVTIGISYSRKATVDASVGTVLQNRSFSSNRLKAYLGRAVRSSLLRNSVGTSYTKINTLLAIKVRALMMEKFRDEFLDVDVDPESIRQSSKSKRGMILMELKICRISDLPEFIRCHVTHYDPDSVQDRITSWGARTMLTWMPQSLMNFTTPVLMEKLKVSLPGLMVRSLLKAKVGKPNVCLFNRRISDEDNGNVDGSHYLFELLIDPIACPQVEAIEPKRKRAKPGTSSSTNGSREVWQVSWHQV